MKKETIFVAMPIDTKFDDVIDAIDLVAQDLNMKATRIDQQQSNEKISDRIIKELQEADYVIADLTDARPNVFFEAGYALGIRKIPIFIAIKGTKLEFDIHDYPIILFGSYVELKSELKKRLLAIKGQPKQENVVAFATPGKASKKEYTDTDKRTILADWIANFTGGGLIQFSEIDEELDFNDGDTNRLLEAAMAAQNTYQLKSRSENVANLVYIPIQRRASSDPWSGFF
jgi:hypothetical protein